MSITDLVPVEYQPPLTKSAAKALDKKIRTASDKLTTNAEALWDLLEQAALGQIHEALEYPSWTAWMKDAVQFTPSDRVERKALAALMSGKGMSQRPIAGTLGVDQKTVSNDLAGTEENSSVKTTLNGKTYKPRKKVTDPAPSDEPLDVEETEAPEPEPEPDADVVKKTPNEWAEIIRADLADAGIDPESTLSTPTVAEEFGAEINNLGIDTQALKDVMGDEVFPRPWPASLKTT
jgi:hypothetical protein